MLKLKGVQQIGLNVLQKKLVISWTLLMPDICIPFHVLLVCSRRREAAGTCLRVVTLSPKLKYVRKTV